MPTVMVADDSAMVRKMYQKFLADTEFKLVALAKHGEEAVNFYGEHKPDIVLLDITMPVMGGIEALGKICESDGGAICVMCSALDQQDLLDKAMELGARDYIVKPFKQDGLLAKLREVAAGE